MNRALLSLACCLLLNIGGCAVSNLPQPSDSGFPWHDREFDYRPGIVTVTKDDLFRLPPDLRAVLQTPEFRQLRFEQRLDRLMTLVFGPPPRHFNYATGHSSIAAVTWKLKRGDCLSLSVLTYAMGRAMDMSPQIQEVDVPAIFDRRGDLDVVNQHVNVIFHNVRREMANFQNEAQDLIVDFEPEYGSNRKGRTLDENSVLARHYNNLGVDYLASGNATEAYAHFKSAILADPAYAASYTNLATLYRRASLQKDAETLLLSAVALSEPPDVALHSLVALMEDTGRPEEAQLYARRLKARERHDPYFWIGLGILHLKSGEDRKAVDDLEHALEMSNGFGDVHRYLAIAYWRVGNKARAQQQIDALARLDEADPAVSLLRKKLDSPHP